MPNHNFHWLSSLVRRSKAKVENRRYVFQESAVYLARQALDWSLTRFELFLPNHLYPENDQIVWRQKVYQPGSSQWFTSEERAIVTVLACLIVPSDENSPGAEHLEVLGLPAVERLDRLVAGSPFRQILYARGLLALDQLATEKCGFKFIDLPTQGQVKLLQRLERWKQDWSISTSLTGKIKRKLIILYFNWTGLYAAVELFSVLVQDVFHIFYTDQVSWTWLGATRCRFVKAG